MIRISKTEPTTSIIKQWENYLKKISAPTSSEGKIIQAFETNFPKKNNVIPENATDIAKKVYVLATKYLVPGQRKDKFMKELPTMSKKSLEEWYKQLNNIENIRNGKGNKIRTLLG